MKLFVALICFLSPYYLGANITLEISVVFRKGVEKNLILVNELHSEERISHKGITKMKMVNGPRIEVQASFFDDNQQYGPSNIIKISPKVYNHKGKRIFLDTKEKIKIFLGSKKKIIFKSDEGEIIEVSILPRI